MRSGKRSQVRKGIAFVYSVHQLDVTQLPGLFIKSLQWAVQAEDPCPAFAGSRFYPILLFPGGSFRAKIDVNRAIGIDLGIRVGADRRHGPARLNHGAGRRIVKDHRPEVFGRNPARNM